IEGIARLAHLLGIEIPIPRCDLESTLFLIDNLLHIGRFTASVCNCGRREVSEKLVNSRDISRRLIFELIRGVIFVAEKFRPFGTKLGCANYNLLCIIGSALAVARE